MEAKFIPQQFQSQKDKENSASDEHKLLFDKIGELQLIELSKHYCLCEFYLSSYCQCKLEDFQNNAPLDFDTQSLRQTQQCSLLPNTRRVLESTSVLPQRDRTSYLYTKLQHLMHQLMAINSSSKTLVFARPKTRRRIPRVSSRRSHFTGVFKNSLKWQALINIRNKKTYIHTYFTQEEAARAFDLMSLLLNGMKAVTNHDYSKDCIIRLFSDYSDIVNKFCYY
ncbi:unnamed protein product [Moneuplotes crassus]|uniref:AP2/ERF domain-containing protein n=1 Tax=Euplotes crassus TaxID=5936 RepID=A0AAD1XUU6_EUPCR|nr:unnamed protein product [Moneuplotes crassus]